MATLTSDSSNLNLMVMGLQISMGGKKTRYQSYGELYILQNSSLAHYKYIDIELRCKITNVEYRVCCFSSFQVEWSRTNHECETIGKQVHIATIQNDAWIPVVG